MTKWKVEKSRVTYTEEYIKKKKATPAPNHYKTEDRRHVRLGKIMKCEGVGFMEGTISHAQKVPEPTKYKVNRTLTERRVTC